MSEEESGKADGGGTRGNVKYACRRTRTRTAGRNVRPPSKYVPMKVIEIPITPKAAFGSSDLQVSLLLRSEVSKVSNPRITRLTRLHGAVDLQVQKTNWARSQRVPFKGMRYLMSVSAAYLTGARSSSYDLRHDAPGMTHCHGFAAASMV